MQTAVQCRTVSSDALTFMCHTVYVTPVPSLPALGPWAPPAERGPSLESIYRAWAPPAERGPSLESIYRVSLTVDLLRRLRQKISSIYCTVRPICNYPSATQEQPFTVGLFCIT